MIETGTDSLGFFGRGVGVLESGKRVSIRGHLARSTT